LAVEVAATRPLRTENFMSRRGRGAGKGASEYKQNAENGGSKPGKPHDTQGEQEGMKVQESKRFDAMCFIHSDPSIYSLTAKCPFLYGI
jgi:hypothetical protein